MSDKHSRAVTVITWLFRHGDMLFLDIDQDVTSVSEISSMDSTPTLTSTGDSSASLSSMVSRPSFSSRDVVADTVDQFLWNQDGKIPRQRNEQLYASIFPSNIISSLMLALITFLVVDCLMIYSFNMNREKTLVSK